LGEGRRERHEEQRELLNSAIDILAELTGRSPGVPDYRHLLALCLRELPGPGPPGSAESDPGDLDRAVVLLEALAADFPEVARYRVDLAETYARQGHGPDAAERLQTATEIIESLIRERPNVPSYRFQLGHVYLRGAHIHRREGRRDEALKMVRRALGIQMELLDDFPDMTPFALTTAFCESALAQMLMDREPLDEPRQLLESATTRLVALGATDEVRPHVRGLAARCFGQLSRVYGDLGLTQQAQAAWTQSEIFRRRPVDATP
jgi:tetratricopeptide (TPR) repeat protein